MVPRESHGDESVVIPAVGVPSALACVRSLGSSGIHTIAVASETPTSAFYSRYCDERYEVPDPDENLLGYRDALIDLAKRPDVRTVVPVREADAFVLSRYRESFEEHVSLVVPPFETLRTVHDRLALAEAAAEAGVPYPETRLLSTVDDWSGDRIVKSRFNVLSQAYVDSLGPSETIEVDSIEHVRSGDVPDADALAARMGHDPIAQEYVRGEEYMVGALYDHGEAVATIQHDQIRGMSHTGSGGVYRESIDDPDLEAASLDLLDHLEWHGLACLEYIRDERTGEFKLAEINPRMWQSVAANVKMGVDFPRYYWLLATGRGGEIDPSYDVGVGCHWLKGEFMHILNLFRKDSPLAERPSSAATIADVATSLVRNPNFDLLNVDDPAPLVQDWWALLCELPRMPDVDLPGGGSTPWYDGTEAEVSNEPKDERRLVAED